ncbi:ribokinase [Subtercola frigoramans]|uniref:Ribokinase n=1 Tax=Subtercola frigoramans TaxID=120298 RepID=A0ABS2L2H0_9MICO|nr:ribokinase [Subtercola frigoramans]MBM7471281.1 ribokinase [Subtercola frigoramans]
MGEIVVVGSINVDQRISVESFPAPGETVLCGMRSTGPGGKGANQAVAARLAGSAVRMIGAVGDDSDGRRMLNLFDAVGIDRSGVLATQTPTGVAVVIVNSAGENSIMVDPGANAALPEVHVSVAMSSMEPGSVLLLQMEIPRSVVISAARSARRQGAVVILNVAPAPPDIDDLIHDVDLLIVNEGELRTVMRSTGSEFQEEPSAMAAILSERFDCTVVCTLGERGAIAVNSQGRIECHAPRVQPVDTTGAGDTFAGYLASALAEKMPIFAALDRATRAASIAVTREGAAESIPRSDELA